MQRSIIYGSVISLRIIPENLAQGFVPSKKKLYSGGIKGQKSRRKPLVQGGD